MLYRFSATPIQILACLEEVKLCTHFESHVTDRLNLVLRDVSERGRDIEGCIKQWFSFVKPNFEQYVEPQKKVAGESTIPLSGNHHTNAGRYHCAKRHRESCGDP
jgi:hypothetical protein